MLIPQILKAEHDA